MKKIHLLAATSALIALSGTAFAADKSQYHLFNPTPREEMRELITDRPDKTESPYSVDAGHFQIETDIATFTRDHNKDNGANVRSSGTTVMLNNFKAGLTNDIDLQIVMESYSRSRATDYVAGQRDVAEGFGDITTRVKFNIWGNDEGDTALALMPFVKFPTNQDDLGNDAVEGGLIVPLAIALPHDLGLGLMTQMNWNEDADGNGYSPEYVNSITLGIPLTEGLGMYTELWSAKSTDTGAEWQASFDVGFTYGMTDDLQLDIGLNTGLTDATDDYNPFIGFSWRY